MNWLRNIVVLAVVMAGTAALAQSTFDRSTLSIETAQGSHEFDIELALAPDQQAQGLMFRQEMAKDAEEIRLMVEFLSHVERGIIR